MDVITLAALAFACGGAAIWFWLGTGKLQDEISKLQNRLTQVEGDAAKHNDRAETLRKKLETAREAGGREDKATRDLRTRAAEAKEEARRLAAALKKAEQTAEEQAVAARRAEARAEELNAVLAERMGKKPVAPPTPAPVAPVQDAPPPVPVEEDPKIALRRAELDAEREQRQIEVQKLRLEREAMRAEQQASSEHERLEQVLAERERLARMVFDRELDLRIFRKKAEDNRRAYLMTMSALDLAEEEVYRMKHGRERPEFDARQQNDAADEVETERPAPEAPAPAPARPARAPRAPRAETVAIADAPSDATPAVEVAPAAEPVEAPAAEAVADLAPAAESSVA